MTPAQDATALADKFSHGDVNAVQFNLGPDRNFETRFWPTIGGARVRNANTPDDGYATHTEALVAGARYRDDCRAALRATSQTPDAVRIASDFWMTISPDKEILRANVRAIGQNIADAITNALRSTPSASAGPQAEAVKPVVSIKTMWKSKADDSADYFVSINVGDRDVTPHVFTERYKAEYHLALYKWLLNDGSKPDLIKFGPNDWPALAHPQPQQADGRGAVIDALKPILENLDGLDKQRTAGPWRKTHDNITSSDRSIEARLVARCDTDWGGGWKHDPTKGSKNARFIVALENAWPKIRAALQQADGAAK